MAKQNKSLDQTSFILCRFALRGWSDTTLVLVSQDWQPGCPGINFMHTQFVLLDDATDIGASTDSFKQTRTMKV